MSAREWVEQSVQYYNHQRPHRSLDGRTPADEVLNWTVPRNPTHISVEGYISEMVNVYIIQRSILILFATVSFLGMGIVGFVPNGLDPITGLFLGSTMALILLRSVIEEYLDELQRWMVFASFGTLYFAIGIFYTWTRKSSLSGELIIGYIACIMVSSLFGYRAIKRGN